MVWDKAFYLGSKKLTSKKGQTFYYGSFYAHKDDYNGKDFAYEGFTCQLDTEAEFNELSSLKPLDMIDCVLTRNGYDLQLRVIGKAAK